MKGMAKEEKKPRLRNTWLYENIPDKEAEQRRQVRIIDESGEDYLYPASYFAPYLQWLPSQKGLLELLPQRQRVRRLRIS